ncbi:MAG: hypothetical protein M1816_005613 [Peltula sp. TS41687]|nr:MAG: hypothetical protein M1816_005613 [Peltula sp. TS41687]
MSRRKKSPEEPAELERMNAILYPDGSIGDVDEDEVDQDSPNIPSRAGEMGTTDSIHNPRRRGNSRGLSVLEQFDDLRKRMEEIEARMATVEAKLAKQNAEIANLKLHFKDFSQPETAFWRCLRPIGKLYKRETTPSCTMEIPLTDVRLYEENL